jgi:peptide/nickel transport system permease protein
MLLFCVSVLSLTLVKFTPGDFFESMRINPQISTEVVAAMRSQQGIDKPLPILYWTWLRSGFRGEWGFSFAYNSPAGPILWPRLRNTLLLSVSATLVAWTIALLLGIAAAAKVGSWADLLASAAAAVLLAVPELVLALLLLLFAAHSHFLSLAVRPSVDLRPMSGWTELQSTMKVLIFPTVCISGGLLPQLIRHVRATVVETLQSPFVTAAHGFGIPYRRILLRHVLPAASNPLISLLGLSLGLLMSSSLVAEAVFNWPGLGQLMLQAISDRDIFLIADAAILAAGFLIAGNFAADVLLHFTDPRIRTR